MNALYVHPLAAIVKETNSGQMVSKEDIDLMCSYIENYGERMFSDDVWNGAFGNVAYAYIHPCNEMRSTKSFNIIQRAFINAYC